MIIAFLYTLKNGEFASVDVISKSLRIDKSKVKKLMDLEKTGMLSTDEFTNYKMKLMSEL